MQLFNEEACQATDWEASGGVLLEVFLVFYIFWGFYLVTDVFFVPAISVLTNKLHIPDDLAGATILGAALNSPELFSNIVGIFVLKDPVGLGLVMGSFNFNILCITGFTAIISRKRLRSRQLKLEWRYLQRDAGLYLAAVLLLIYVASDQLLEAWECFAMLALYVLYIVLCMMTGYIARMCCTPTRKPRRKRPLGRIICEVMGEEWVKSLLEQQPPSRSSTDHDPGTNISEPYQPPTEAVMSAANGDRRAPAAADTACNFPSVKAIRTESSPVFFSQLGSGQQTSATASPSAPGTPVWSQDGEVKATELRKVLQDLLDNGYTSLHHHKKVAPLPGSIPNGNINRSLSAPASAVEAALTASLPEDPEPLPDLEQPLLTTVAADVPAVERQMNWTMVQNMLEKGSASEINHLLKADARLIAVAIDNISHRKFATDVMQLAELIESADEAETHQHEALLKWPQGKGFGAKLGFVMTFPINALMSLTMFHQKELYLLTIGTAIAWLGVLAYLLDWSAARVGCFLNINDQLIGMTVVAIGTSLPNVFAAVSAGAKGQVETSISQAFGSNIFDILIAFALPYTIQCGLQGWQPIHIAADNVSKDGLIDVAVLFVYIALLCYTRMRLTRVQGFLCLGMYGLYLGYEVVAFLG